MADRVQGQLFSLVVLCTLAGALGCSAFLPAHSNSMIRDNESVAIELISCVQLSEAVNAALLADWKEVFPDRFPGECTPKPAEKSPPKPGPQAIAFAAPAAAAIIGMAVDLTAAELRRESTEYESQYGVVKAGDRFWVAFKDDKDAKATIPVPYDELHQHYYAIRVKRAAGEPVEPAFELVIGIAPSFDRQMFQLAPLRLHVPHARAKVLSDERRWWPVATTWIGRLFRTSGHEIDVSAALSVEAYWKDDKQQLQAAKLATSEWRFPSYDIATPLIRRAACPSESKDCASMESAASGWLMSIPVSLAPGNTSLVPGRGTFAVEVTITERDRSNAKQYLETAARLLSEQKPKIVEQVGRRLGGN